MTYCEDCRRPHGLTHRLKDGQRATLCLSCARRWRLVAPDLFPRPYGREARAAYDATSVVAVTA